MPSDQYQNEALGGNQFTPNTVWASAPATGQTEELTTPLGQTCRAKKISVPNLIEAGLLNQGDSLTAMVRQHTDRQTKGGPDGTVTETVNTEALMSDPAALKAIIMLADKTLPHIVVSPVVKLHFTEHTVGQTTVTKMIPVEDREPGVVYTDQVDFSDKMWLFDWATGGLRTMTPFREGSTPSVGTVGHVTKSPRKTKRAPRRP